jgi:site-specific DNA-adenine methylase
MWSYYGSKSKIIDYYPPPKYGKIIEPFAGTARYALKYFDRDVLLVDKYEVVIRIWKWLQVCSPNDILNLPKLKLGDNINSFNLSETEKDFLGFLITRGVESPRRNVSSFVGDITPNLKSISKKVNLIKHWNIQLADYRDILNQEATWFIDPPYQYGGEYYIHSNKQIDYELLGDWCKSRFGHIMVCENTKADWMNFKPMRTMTGSIHTTTEAIWSNFPTEYDYLQPTLIVV